MPSRSYSNGLRAETRDRQNERFYRHPAPVVVVSTCYSGAFVDALKDDSTLVIAASAGDRLVRLRQRCGLTYFGKACFDEALRRTDSFSDAFEMARTKPTVVGG